MGSGISLNKDQIIHIIKRDLEIEFNNNENEKPRFTDDGYEIHYDYSDEVDLNDIIRTLNMYRRREKQIEN
jgi:hypothetical protein